MVMATVARPWIPNLTIEQSVKSEQIFMIVNDNNNISEVVNATATVPTQSKRKKCNRGVKDGMVPMVLPSSKRKSRKRKSRKFRKKSKKSQTLDIKPPTVPAAGHSHDNNPLENMDLHSKQSKELIPPPPSPTDIRFAALKSMLLQAKGRGRSNNPEQELLPKSTVAKSRSIWSTADLFEDIARRRIASPQLIVPAADDYWGILNHEKRSEKINMESIDLFLREDSDSRG